MLFKYQDLKYLKKGDKFRHTKVDYLVYTHRRLNRFSYKILDGVFTIYHIKDTERKCLSQFCELYGIDIESGSWNTCNKLLIECSPTIGTEIKMMFRKALYKIKGDL